MNIVSKSKKYPVAFVIEGNNGEKPAVWIKCPIEESGTKANKERVIKETGLSLEDYDISFCG